MTSTCSPDEVSAAPPLDGTRVIEVASFVAVPSAGLTFSQLGARVIRIDPPGGASDIHRWPVTRRGVSLFWAGLNKGKRSVCVDYRRPEGRELVLELVASSGPDGGILLDNLVGRHRFDPEELKRARPDAIHLHLEGKPDGAPAVDYTINAEIGVPAMTGPVDSAGPVNHVVPAWDLLAGMTAVSAVLAALHRRRRTGEGAEIELSLLDVALAGVGNMGWLAEAQISGNPRSRHGNHMYGSFGVDFETSDGRRVMVVALTEAQWRALREVTETAPVFEALEKALDADLGDEADRYRLRETIEAILRPWFAARDFLTVARLLDDARVLWSPYAEMHEVARNLQDTPRSIAQLIEQPDVGAMLATGSPVRGSWDTKGPLPAPRLGADTEWAMAELLGLSDAEIGRLEAAGIVGARSGGLR